MLHTAHLLGLVTNRKTLGISHTVCSWILEFLNSSPQSGRVDYHTSPALTLSTGCPQDCVLSLMLYCIAKHNNITSTIVTITESTTLVGIITNNNKEPNREVWYSSSTDVERKALQRVVNTVQSITAAVPPPIQDFYNYR